MIESRSSWDEFAPDGYLLPGHLREMAGLPGVSYMRLLQRMGVPQLGSGRCWLFSREEAALILDYVNARFEARLAYEQRLAELDHDIRTKVAAFPREAMEGVGA